MQITEKTRISLSSSQWAFILECIAASPHHPEYEATSKAIRLHQWKWENQLIKPSHVTIVRPSTDLDDSLGFSSPQTPIGSLDEQREALYKMHSEQGIPLSRFSKAQLQMIQDYRYGNDLMSPEEEAAYEASMG